MGTRQCMGLPTTGDAVITTGRPTPGLALRHMATILRTMGAGFRTDPDMVFLTGWNRWTMNRLQGPPEQPVRFVDNANEEYSRDIEMMAGGHGDNYYLQMTANIRRYKGI